MSKNVCGERLINGIVKENPTFVMMLGMCPTLAVTTTFTNSGKIIARGLHGEELQAKIAEAVK